MNALSRRPRGARRSPAAKAFRAQAFRAQAVPDTFCVIPSQLSMWGNATFGDCCSAEEAAAKAVYSLMAGGSAELFITQDEVVAWATLHGFLDGAELTSVMEAMALKGMTAGGQLYNDGPYQSVDWTDDATLSSAIYQGPVKIGVAADQLEATVPNPPANGWIATDYQADANLDHCVHLNGFGSLASLCAALGVAVPAGLDPTTRCYTLFTWDSIGIIDRASMIAITGEAWLRTPTTVGAPVPAPSPIPTPTPAPTPPPPPTPAAADSVTVTVGGATYTGPLTEQPPAGR